MQVQIGIADILGVNRGILRDLVQISGNGIGLVGEPTGKDLTGGGLVGHLITDTGAHGNGELIGLGAVHHGDGDILHGGHIGGDGGAVGAVEGHGQQLGLSSGGDGAPGGAGLIRRLDSVVSHTLVSADTGDVVGDLHAIQGDPVGIVADGLTGLRPIGVLIQTVAQHVAILVGGNQIRRGIAVGLALLLQVDGDALEGNALALRQVDNGGAAIFVNGLIGPLVGGGADIVDIEADFLIDLAVNNGKHIVTDDIQLAFRVVLPAVQGLGNQVGVGNLPDIIGLAGGGGKALTGFARGEGINLGTCLAVESSAVEVAAGDLVRQIKPGADGIGIRLHSLSRTVLVHADVDHVEGLVVGEPDVLVGVGGGEGHIHGVAFGQVAIVENVAAEIVVIGHIIMGNRVGDVIGQASGAVLFVVSSGLDLLGQGGRLHHGAVFVDGLALVIDQIVVDQDVAAAHGDLGNREGAHGVLAQVVLIAEGGAFIGIQHLTGGGIAALLNGDLVLHDGVVALADAADRPVDPASVNIIGGAALADIDVRVTGVIDHLVGGDDRGGTGEAQLDLVAHGIGHGAIGRGDGDAAGDGLKGGGELLLHVVILANGVVALGSIGGAGLQGVLAVGTGLEGHGEDGGPGGLGLVGLPDGGDAMIKRVAIHCTTFAMFTRYSEINLSRLILSTGLCIPRAHQFVATASHRNRGAVDLAA